MSRIKSILNALKMTPWFIVNSWSYVTTKTLESKTEYFTGLIPAWYRFTVITYKDCRVGYEIVDMTEFDV